MLPATTVELMDSLEQYATTLPIRELVMTNLQAEVAETLDRIPGLAVSGALMTPAQMRDALTLPWNLGPAEVEEQIVIRVDGRAYPVDSIVSLLERAFRPEEVNPRPARYRSRRTALSCVIPLHLQPPEWERTPARPTRFVIDVEAA